MTSEFTTIVPRITDKDLIGSTANLKPVQKTVKTVQKPTTNAAYGEYIKYFFIAFAIVIVILLIWQVYKYYESQPDSQVQSATVHIQKPVPVEPSRDLDTAALAQYVKKSNMKPRPNPQHIEKENYKQNQIEILVTPVNEVMDSVIMNKIMEEPEEGEIDKDIFTRQLIEDAENELKLPPESVPDSVNIRMDEDEDEDEVVSSQATCDYLITKGKNRGSECGKKCERGTRCSKHI